MDDDPTGMNLTPALSIDLLRPFIDLDKAGNRVVTIKKTSIVSSGTASVQYLHY